MIKFSEMGKVEMEELLKGGMSIGSEGGRKLEVLGVLKEGIVSIEEVGKRIGISSRNVSCLLSYLKKDGYDIRRLKSGGVVKLVLWGKGEKRFDWEKGEFEK